MRVFRISCLVLVILVINSSSVFSAITDVCTSCGGCLSVKSSDGKLINCPSPSRIEMRVSAGCHGCDCCRGCIVIFLRDGTVITCKSSNFQTVLNDKTIVRF
jgi:hypothetical protein